MKIHMRKTQFFGHLVRKDKMQKSLLEGKTCAKWPRGRPRKSWMKSIMGWIKLNFEQCIGGAEDRDYWRGVTTNLLNWSSHWMMMMKWTLCKSADWMGHQRAEIKERALYLTDFMMLQNAQNKDHSYSEDTHLHC